MTSSSILSLSSLSWCWTNLRTSVREKFALLDDCPYEIYVNFCLKFGEAYGYFALSQILVIYLHEEYNISDLHAGMIYGFWGVGISFWGFVTSCFNDYFGVRRSLLIGFAISMFSNICLALNQDIHFFYIILFGLLPIGNSIGIPMLTVGIKRYTTKRNRGFAFGLFYAVMNIAALVSGPVVDFFNVVICPSGSSCSSTYRHDDSSSDSSSGKPNRLITGNRLVIWSVVIVYFCAWWTTYLLLREVRVSESPEEVTERGERDQESLRRVLDEDDDLERDFEKSFGEESRNPVLGSDSSHRLLSSKPEISNHEDNADPGDEIELTLYPSHSNATARRRNPQGYSTVDVQEDLEDQSHESHIISTNSTTSLTSSSSVTIPSTSPNSTTSSRPGPPKITSAYAYVLEIVSTLTFWRFCLLTLFLINLKTIFRHLDATLPTYLLRCFGPSYPKGMIYSINPMMIIWLTPAVAAFTTHWPHFDMIKYGGYLSAISPFFLVISTSTWSVVLFMIVLSLGEAIWSPRLYDYTMSIAPDGREASFSALAALPIFAAQIPTGMLSGYLLHTYLHEGQTEREDQRGGKTMWLIIGLVTLSSPVLITLCERWIREPEKSRPPSRQSSRHGNRQMEDSEDDMIENPLQGSHSSIHEIRMKKNAFTIISQEEEEEDDEYEDGEGEVGHNYHIEEEEGEKGTSRYRETNRKDLDNLDHVEDSVVIASLTKR